MFYTLDLKNMLNTFQVHKIIYFIRSINEVSFKKILGLKYPKNKIELVLIGLIIGIPIGMYITTQISEWIDKNTNK